MTDLFHGSKYSIGRAKHHISDLERQAIEFLDTNPYSRVIEADVDTGGQLCKITLTKQMPVALPGLAFDAVNNLRSALDQSIWAIAKAAKKDPRFASFPFAKDANHINNAINGRCKDLPCEIRDLIRTFKPYKGGNNLLWALNELCNTNKHAIVCPIAIASKELRVDNPVAKNVAIMVPRWDRLKNEMILFRIGPGGELQTNYSFTVSIVMGAIEFVNGQPADAVLNEFVRIVEGIVMGLEAVTRRLGLI